MSTQRKQTTSFNKSIKSSMPIKCFCKVCKDAGKSEAEYTSHFVRENPDPKSKVVCPTLLNLTCSYCKKAGHTVGYCNDAINNKKAIEKKQRENARQDTRDVEETSKSKSTEKKANNAFAALCDSSDSEGEEDVKTFKNKDKNKNKNVSDFVLKVEKRMPMPTPMRMSMPGNLTEEDFPQLNARALVNKEQNQKEKGKEAYKSFASITLPSNNQDTNTNTNTNIKTVQRLDEMDKKRTQVVFKTPVVLRTTSSSSSQLKGVPILPGIFHTPAKSTLFDKPEYLDISDDEEEEEEEEIPEIDEEYEEYKRFAGSCVPRKLEFDLSDFDEDW
jgi:hypothetical protein